MKREDLLLLLVFLLFVQGYLLRNPFSSLLGFSILAYLVYLRREFSPHIEAVREVDSQMVEGAKSSWRVNIKNHSPKKLRVQLIELLPPGFESDAPSTTVEGFEEKTIDYGVTPVKGVYTIPAPVVRATDPSGLYYADTRAGSSEQVEVQPSVEGIREDVRGESIRTRNIRALFGLQTMEMDSLRKFQEGDETRKIDWKATARLGELIVREFIREQETDIYIIQDAGREMRKGIKTSRIDYSTTLALQLAHVLREYSVGLIVYDDVGVVKTVRASRSNQEEKFAKALNVTPVYSELLGAKVKVPETGFKPSNEAQAFLKKVLPAIKGRKSYSTGLVEAVSLVSPTSGLLIFIADVTGKTSQLIKTLNQLKNSHRILLLTPNPILFYDESKLDRRTALWLYKRYTEREELLKRLNQTVTTLDVGPSDLVDVIGGWVK